MCVICNNIILNNIHVGGYYQTFRGRPFTITNIIVTRLRGTIIRGGEIHIRTSLGGIKWFHIEHAGMCLHWMLMYRRTINGVGSARYSVRGLVGTNGILIHCTKCDRNSSYIWGILSALPMVKRRGNQLYI